MKIINWFKDVIIERGLLMDNKLNLRGNK